MLKHKVWKLIGLVILAYILSRIDWGQFKHVIQRAKWGWILWALFLNIPQLWLKATRWQNLLLTQGKKIKNMEAFLYYLSATYLGVVTPGRLGEFAKAIYLKENGIAGISYGLSSVLVDRLWDLSLLLILGFAGLIMLHPWPQARLMGWFGILCFVIVCLYVKFSKSIERISTYLYKKLANSKMPEIAKEGAQQFRLGFRQLWGKRIWQSAMLTSFAYAIFFLQCFLILKAFMIPLTYCQIVPVMAMVNLFSFIPISVSGLGTRDAALLFLMGQKGIGYESIMAFSMGVLLVFYIGGGILGMIAWFLRPLGSKIK